jgi:hypothetical protein
LMGGSAEPGQKGPVIGTYSGNVIGIHT